MLDKKMKKMNAEIETVQCSECGESVPVNEVTEIDDKQLCWDCYRDTYSTCDHCGARVPFGTLEEVHTAVGEIQYWCSDCVDNETFTCDDCEQIWANGHSHETENGKTVCDKCREENYVRCSQCGAIVHKDDVYSDNHGYYCEQCYFDTHSLCDHCGESVHEDDLEAVMSRNGWDYGTEEWCSDCIRRDAVRCYECGHLADDSIVEYDASDNPICPDCVEAYYYHCESCGDLVREDAIVRAHNEIYCESCAEDVDDIIHPYHSDIRPLLWHGSDGSNIARMDNLHVGVELELCNGGEDDYNAKEIIHASGYEIDASFVCEHDSSLRRGFEIISSTATIPFHLEKYGWNDIMNKALELGYCSHNGSCCGLHVHVDRMYFAGNMDDPEAIAVVLVTNNMDWLKKFSRRNYWNYCEFVDDGDGKFAASDFEEKYFPADGKRHTKAEVERTQRYARRRISQLKDAYEGHGVALNFGGYSTIEFRFNRGTLRFSTFKASLQLIDMMAYAMKHCRLSAITNVDLRWFRIMAKRKGYTEFLAYLKERNIH